MENGFCDNVFKKLKRFYIEKVCSGNVCQLKRFAESYKMVLVKMFWKIKRIFDIKKLCSNKTCTLKRFAVS